MMLHRLCTGTVVLKLRNGRCCISVEYLLVNKSYTDAKKNTRLAYRMLFISVISFKTVKYKKNSQTTSDDLAINKR